ncbi:unnamed protein product [Dovyalis caffra]|uniref:DC1 domain-containing protein n=1 Tax=Dovyalis caffra TaxID=77055 RepID=A0AAV1QWE3_9ROSI|nr:unnamed protein product [Dovyalis caffra]
MAMVNVSSCPSPQMLLHRTHIHPLYEVPIDVDYTCDGCQTFGCEKSYGCNACNFDLHPYCATCPSELESRMHKHHQLTLIYPSGNDYVCDLCDEDVEGFFYRCSFCYFNIHPLCTQIPQKVQH